MLTSTLSVTRLGESYLDTFWYSSTKIGRPGEHLICRGDNGERRPAVVQSFDAHHRTADLLFTDTNEKQIVSVLELDTGGSPRTGYGLAYGQRVLLCSDNGSVGSEVPCLGRNALPVGHLPWRDELVKLAETCARNPSDFGWNLPEGKRDGITWWGEIVQLHLDGTVSVELPNGELRRVGIKNLYIFRRGYSLSLGSMGSEYFLDTDEAMGSEVSWETMSREASDIEVDDLGDEGLAIDEEDERDRIEIEEVEPVVSEGAAERQQHDMNNLPEAGSSSTANGQLAAEASLKDDEQWRQFEVLDQAPSDHHFVGEPRSEAASKIFHSRLHREHRALMSSLPGEERIIP